MTQRLLNLPRARQDNADAVRGVADEAKEIICSLQNLGEVPWNAMIVHIVCSKLPNATLALWEQQCGNSTVICDFQVLDDFFENRIRTLHAIESKSQYTMAHVSAVESPKGGQTQKKEQEQRATITCAFCSCAHLLYKCDDFIKKSPHDRQEFVSAKELCSLCLNSHPDRPCKFSFGCGVCKGKHNTLLHFGSSSTLSATSGAKDDDVPVVLPTAQINLTSKYGVQFPFRILIDQGSMRSFISENAMQLLKWDRVSNSTLVKGFNGRRTRALHSHFRQYTTTI